MNLGWVKSRSDAWKGRGRMRVHKLSGEFNDVYEAARLRSLWRWAGILGMKSSQSLWWWRRGKLPQSRDVRQIIHELWVRRGHPRFVEFINECWRGGHVLRGMDGLFMIWRGLP